MSCFGVRIILSLQKEFRSLLFLSILCNPLRSIVASSVEVWWNLAVIFIFSLAFLLGDFLLLLQAHCSV
jgi:hypothetical protein